MGLFRRSRSNSARGAGHDDIPSQDTISTRCMAVLVTAAQHNVHFMAQSAASAAEHYRIFHAVAGPLGIDVALLDGGAQHTALTSPRGAVVIGSPEAFVATYRARPDMERQLAFVEGEPPRDAAALLSGYTRVQKAV